MLEENLFIFLSKNGQKWTYFSLLMLNTLELPRRYFPSFRMLFAKNRNELEPFETKFFSFGLCDYFY